MISNEWTDEGNKANKMLNTVLLLNITASNISHIVLTKKTNLFEKWTNFISLSEHQRLNVKTTKTIEKRTIQRQNRLIKKGAENALSINCYLWKKNKTNF